MPMAGMMMAAPIPGAAGAAAAEAAPPAAPEKTDFDIKLDAFDAAKKIALIKEVREVTGLGLKEAKALVDGSPTMVKEKVSKDEAMAIKQKLEAHGATIILE
jgi:large subunit ribosomal protein L7/L12